MIVPHPLDLIAILLGIFLALRKSDVRAEELSFHPNVPAAAFERWRQRASFAYTLGTRACFAKVVLDFAFLALLRRVTFDLNLQRVIGASLDIGWIIAMIACWILARRARKYADAIGMRLGSPPPGREAVAEPTASDADK